MANFEPFFEYRHIHIYKYDLNVNVNENITILESKKCMWLLKNSFLHLMVEVTCITTNKREQ